MIRKTIENVLQKVEIKMYKVTLPYIKGYEIDAFYGDILIAKEYGGVITLTKNNKAVITNFSPHFEEGCSPIHLKEEQQKLVTKLQTLGSFIMYEQEEHIKIKQNGQTFHFALLK